MPERILFLTGRLAEKPLHRVLESMQPAGFSYKVEQVGVSVAALMTPKLIQRRLADAKGADRIMVPGRVRGDLDALSRHYGVPVVRGPEDLKDLPDYFGHGGKEPDLSKYDVRIFAEIVDAPLLDVAGILARAEFYRAHGADVIDLGCLPETDFPHLEESVRALKKKGFAVSVDSADLEELRRGGKAGADYVLSLTEETLALADEIESIPVLIPAKPGDMDSLMRAVAAMRAKGKAFLADPILDPIHFGFTESVARYLELRRRDPEVEILMGLGNLTELTGADTVGITATLMGVASELSIRNVLVVQVSPHARRAVKEVDVARRIMHLAREEQSLPIGHSELMLCLHDRRPHAYTEEEVEELARQIKDPSFRVIVTEQGIHIFNRDLHRCSDDPFELFPHLGVEKDGAHAFYLGVELARAQTAFQLGKSYDQDGELDWGCAADKVRPGADLAAADTPGHTLAAKKKQAEEKRARKAAGDRNRGGNRGGKKRKAKS